MLSVKPNRSPSRLPHVSSPVSGFRPVVHSDNLFERSATLTFILIARPNGHTYLFMYLHTIRTVPPVRMDNQAEPGVSGSSRAEASVEVADWMKSDTVPVFVLSQFRVFRCPSGQSCRIGERSGDSSVGLGQHYLVKNRNAMVCRCRAYLSLRHTVFS